MIGKMLGLAKDDLKEEMQFVQMELMEKMLPLVKQFAPKIEKEAKKFVEENNCIIVIKMEKNGDLTCSVLKKDMIEVVPKEGVEINSSEDLFVKQKDNNEKMIFSLNSLMEMFSKGFIDKFIQESKNK